MSLSGHIIPIKYRKLPHVIILCFEHEKVTSQHASTSFGIQLLYYNITRYIKIDR